MIIHLKRLALTSLLVYVLCTISSVFAPEYSTLVLSKVKDATHGLSEYVVTRGEIFEPYLDQINQKYYFVERYETHLKAGIDYIVAATYQAQERIGVLEKLALVHKRFVRSLETAKEHISGRLVPLFTMYLDHLKLFVWTKSKLFSTRLNFEARRFFVRTWSTLDDFYIMCIKPRISFIEHNKYAVWVKSRVSKLIEIVCNLWDVNTFHERRDFLKAEFQHFMGLWPDSYSSAPVPERTHIKEVVKDILNDASHSTLLAETTSSQDKSPNKLSRSDDIHSTSADSGIDELQQDELAIERDDRFFQIRDELLYWEQRINKTLTIAEADLKKQMAPIIERIIDEAKPRISEVLTDLQTANYNRYKAMNVLINLINKDSSDIKEYKKIINSSDVSGREFVSRQDMRDHIQGSLNFTQLETAKAKSILQYSHDEVLKSYFKAIQETIDVLESFADSTVTEFASRLHALLSLIEDESDIDETISWAAWKKFHAIKEEIFNFRDKLFDEAYAYQKDPYKEQPPLILMEWNIYLNKVNFHIHFLLHDNEEYLRLVRAKANVAYQLRESLNSELEHSNNESSEGNKSQEAQEGSTDETVKDDESEFMEEESDELEQEEN